MAHPFGYQNQSPGGAAHEAFSAWLGEARARLGADQTLTRLEGVLLVSLGGDGQTTQP